MVAQQPCIGFFDSGQGGLTVWEDVVALFPGVHTVYLGDNARVPYGNKGVATVLRYTQEALGFLHQQGAQVVVVACGTASSQALPLLQLGTLPFPVVGIVEGLCQQVWALSLPPHAAVAVLGTRGTIASSLFEQVLTNSPNQKEGVIVAAPQVWQRACPLFVSLVEEGVGTGPLADAAAEMYLWDIPENTGAVVLGCTHFPRMAQAIAGVLHRRLGRSVVLNSPWGPVPLVGGVEARGNPVYLLESSVSIAHFLGDFLQAQGINGQGNKMSRGTVSGFFNENVQESVVIKHRIFCTDSPPQFLQAAHRFLRGPLPPDAVLQKCDLT